MKAYLSLTFLVLFSLVFSQSPRHFYTTTNTSGVNYDLQHSGRIILGDEYVASLPYFFQVFEDATVNVSNAFGNAGGRLEINSVGITGSFSPISKPGDIVLKRLGPTSQNLIFQLGNTIPINSPYNASDNFKFRFASGASLSSLLIYSTGKITMGTEKYDDSDYRLFVKDGIKTEKVKVELASANGWADYVFHDDYELMPIKDVESFINQNGHLPNILSAEEVVEDGGFELKEMNIKLLEKIEELTLYIIEQNKRIEALEAKVAED